MAPEDLKLDPFTVSEVSIDRATLRAVVSSSGGCRAHHYDLYMTPSVFMESFPVQANLYMRHDDDDDPCDAIVVETLTFDLTPIITLYRQMYGPSGQVALNFFDYDQSASTRLILQVE